MGIRKNDRAMSFDYKKQFFFALIPILGFFIVLFKGFFQIKKESLKKAIIYFIYAYVFLFASMIIFFFPINQWLFEQVETIKLIFGLLIMYLWLLLPSLALVGLQKKFLK